MKTILRPFMPILALAGLGALAALTYSRNAAFHTPVTLWESAVKSSPTKRRAHENYGQALSTAGKLADALREFQTVIALPDDGSVPPRDLYREIGVVYFRLGLIDESIVAWQKGLTFAPFDPGVLNNLSIAFLKKGRLDEALSHAQTAVSVNSMMPEPYNTLGEIYLAKGDFRKAAQMFLAYVQLRPENINGYWNTTLAFMRAGDFQNALRFANLYYSMAPDARSKQDGALLIQNIQSSLSGRK